MKHEIKRCLIFSKYCSIYSAASPGAALSQGGVGGGGCVAETRADDEAIGEEDGGGRQVGGGTVGWGTVDRSIR